MRLSATILLVTTLIMNSGCRKDDFPIKEKKIPITVGQTKVDLVVYATNEPGLTYLCLHDNEDTSPEAVLDVMKRRGGRLIELQHTGERNISFELQDSVYTFDPNRIFTNEGIQATLEELSEATDEAKIAVHDFALRILQVLQLSNDELIVAVHNNTEGEYSMYSYLPGGDEEMNARFANLVDEVNADDFFFATHPTLYTAIREGGFNVVLQDNLHVVDDGSLSVYCGRRSVPYVNVEAQHGHFDEQVQMLEYLNSLDFDALILEPA